MRRSDVFGYAFMEGVKPEDVCFDNKQLERNEEDVRNVEPSDSLLRLIYTIDERTKTPTGDLTYFVSDKANPEIKKFILDNLLMDVSGNARPAIPNDIDDDTALLFARADGESLDAYVTRLNQEVDRAKWLNQNAKLAVSEDSVQDKSSE